ncbi:hypothetical protein [Acidovorax sp. NCPPB 4044]|uniref:hypothetical protein n=1 Tax=Acidovorax sp. NCPPB 4044 TaxID=2940490 RepID=UPI0023043A19|nr:hypothetical protein [Acidovorax sp. NCPPB 4044]MDA8522301.1 hypothetical protein [Acidovorax sp. NCPPB 4044]
MTIYIFVQNGVLAGVQRTTGVIDAEGYVQVPEDPGTDGIGRPYLGLNGAGMPMLGPVPSPDLGRRISVGAFYDRFGAAKWAILADETPTVRAVVRDASVRKWIDLDNPDLPAGLAILHDAGHDIDAQAIVGQPVAAEERP